MSVFCLVCQVLPVLPKFARIYLFCMSVVIHSLLPTVDNCCLSKPELSPAPEFREISQIREFSENSTEFLCHFQNWSKTPQKASKCYRNVEKAPEIAQNFYIFVKSTPKSSRKAPEFFKKYYRTFPFLSKVPKKAPEKLPNSGEISIWRQLCLARSFGQSTSLQQLVKHCIYLMYLFQIQIFCLWFGFAGSSNSSRSCSETS